MQSQAAALAKFCQIILKAEKTREADGDIKLRYYIPIFKKAFIGQMKRPVYPHFLVPTVPYRVSGNFVSGNYNTSTSLTPTDEAKSV